MEKALENYYRFEKTQVRDLYPVLFIQTHQLALGHSWKGCTANADLSSNPEQRHNALRDKKQHIDPLTRGGCAS
jgi:hypothetical protein